jgi:hypothetical protein
MNLEYPDLLNLSLHYNLEHPFASMQCLFLSPQQFSGKISQIPHVISIAGARMTRRAESGEETSGGKMTLSPPLRGGRDVARDSSVD